MKGREKKGEEEERERGSEGEWEGGKEGEKERRKTRNYVPSDRTRGSIYPHKRKYIPIQYGVDTCGVSISDELFIFSFQCTRNLYAQ